MRESAETYAQRRANETGRSYLVVRFSGTDERPVSLSMLDCAWNRRVIRECNAVKPIVSKFSRKAGA